MTMAFFNRTPIKRSPLKRSTKPVKKVSKARRARSGKPGKLGITRLYGKAKTKLRRDCYERDNERCVADGCGKWLPFDGSLLTRMHMSHKVGLGAGGSDVLDNVETRCPEHHLVDCHNPKSVPRKVKPR